MLSSRCWNLSRIWKIKPCCTIFEQSTMLSKHNGNDSKINNPTWTRNWLVYVTEWRWKWCDSKMNTRIKWPQRVRNNNFCTHYSVKINDFITLEIRLRESSLRLQDNKHVIMLQTSLLEKNNQSVSIAKAVWKHPERFKYGFVSVQLADGDFSSERSIRHRS